MSALVTVWNTKSTPVQISAQGVQAPGLASSLVDASDIYVRRLIEAGVLVVLSDATEVAEQAIVATTEEPAEVQAEPEQSDEPEPVEEAAEASEDAPTDEAPKATKSTRKTQTAGKES